MKKYVVYNIVNKIKFYLKNNGEWEQSYKNLKIYLEDEVAMYFDKKSKRSTLKTKYSIMTVEEFISYETES